jgi:hypothetical protein
MAWEERGGRRYYYRKVRKGGRVFSVYEGGGLSGTLAERQESQGRESREQERARLRKEAEREDSIDALVDSAWAIARRAEAASLEAAGYHLHNRQWRLRREQKAAGESG